MGMIGDQPEMEPMRCLGWKRGRACGWVCGVCEVCVAVWVADWAHDGATLDVDRAPIIYSELQCGHCARQS